MTLKTVIGDADSLIALFLDYDSNHERATLTLKKLNEEGVTIVYPNTAIAEAITTLLRRHSNPALAAYVTEQYKNGNFNVEYIGEKTMMHAATLFNPHGSKQNTFFDAIVAATARILAADAIFTFDTWYTKQGFSLVSDVV